MSERVSGITMIATLGFGIDFIVRRLADLRGESVSRIVVVGLYTDKSSWQRIEQTYSILAAYLTGQGIGSRLERIDLHKGGLVRQARDIIARTMAESSDDLIELYLTGGPRILLATFYTAALTLSRVWAERIRISVYGEGFPASLTVETSVLLVLASIDEVSRRILEYIRDGYNNVHNLRAALGLPRSTLYKKLKDLEDLGLIVRVGRGEFRVHPSLDQVF
ncbi:MAG: CRISPR-associated CARF protein Csa3 [Desulfurococcales archaeon]|nr:CRISPR-associated CARF protein Csa3 [Desulfurococcales archaeon]